MPEYYDATTLGGLCSCVTVQLLCETIRILPIQVRARERARLLCYPNSTQNQFGEKNRLCSLQSSKCLKQLLSAMSTFLYSGIVIQGVNHTYDDTFLPAHNTRKPALTCYNLIPHSTNLGGLGRSFRCNDLWDRLDGQRLIVIGCLEYHRPIIALVHTNYPRNQRPKQWKKLPPLTLWRTV